MRLHIFHHSKQQMYQPNILFKPFNLEYILLYLFWNATQTNIGWREKESFVFGNYYSQFHSWSIEHFTPQFCICCRMKKVLQFEFLENNMVYTFFLQKKSQSVFLTIYLAHKHVTFRITHVCYSVQISCLKQ